MAQSAPLRLDSGLVREADAVGKLYKRSPPRQIEYWAELGKVIEEFVTPEELIAIREGLSQLVIQPLPSAPIRPEQVFASLARDRSRGTLIGKVSDHACNYQASPTQPGLLEQINSDGSKITGRFRNGQFEASSNYIEKC